MIARATRTRSPRSLALCAIGVIAAAAACHDAMAPPETPQSAFRYTLTLASGGSRTLSGSNATFRVYDPYRAPRPSGAPYIADYRIGDSVAFYSNVDRLAAPSVGAYTVANGRANLSTHLSPLDSILNPLAGVFAYQDPDSTGFTIDTTGDSTVTSHFLIRYVTTSSRTANGTNTEVARVAGTFTARRTLLP